MQLYIINTINEKKIESLYEAYLEIKKLMFMN